MMNVYTRLLVILFIISVCAHEALATKPSYDVKLIWKTPTQYTDGKDLPKDHIHKYTVRYTNLSTNEALDLDITDLTKSETVIPNLKPGGYSFKLKTITIFGTESDWSLPAETTAHGRPKAPSEIKLELHCMAGCTALIEVN